MKCYQVQRQSSQRFTRGEQISEEETRTQNSCSQMAPKTACSFFQTCSFLFFFFFSFCMGARQWWREEGSGYSPSGLLPCCVHWLEAAELGVRMWDVPRKRATTVAFQASSPWRPEAGAWGLLSPDSAPQEAPGSGARLLSENPPARGDLSWGACCIQVGSGESPFRTQP